MIYLDNHATTKVDERVLQVMMPYFSTVYGNPASQSHGFGREAAKSVEKARQQVAGLLSAAVDEIFFTSGATESNNLALKGAWEFFAGGKEGAKPLHLITQATEHKSILETCRYLEKKGVRVTYLPVDEYGLVSIRDVENALTEETFLISIMAANNEVGTLQPLAEIGGLAKERGVLFHVDAAQAAGKIPVSVDALGIDLLSLTAHKFYGPKGTGALYVRKKNPRVRLEPLIHGGLHEDGLRSGTLNVPGIVGLGEACRIAGEEMTAETQRVKALRDDLQQRLLSGIEDARINGHPERRLAGNLNISFAYVEGDGILMGLQNEIALSSSSACSSGNMTPSYVLKAMGVDRRYIHSAIRFGIGRFTTRQEIEQAADAVLKIVKHLRDTSPVYQSAKRERRSQ